ncbi:putative sugar kinase, partial [Haematococcus lacustris]
MEQLKAHGCESQVSPGGSLANALVAVLTTPDAQRSFLSFFDSGKLCMTATIATAITAARVLVIEGYLLELPGARTWLPEVLRLARVHSVRVALTAGDPGVVQRHRDMLQDLLSMGCVDLLFCNREEACELLGRQALEEPEGSSTAAAAVLGRQ